MNFDNFVKWHEASYQPDSDTPKYPASTYPDHATDTPDYENSNSEDIVRNTFL